MTATKSVCIIGLGPWGLCALERIVAAAREVPGTAVIVHVVEPNRPGGGLYAAGEPDYFVLNTPCGQHSMYPFPELVEPGSLGKGFYEWVSEKGYRWDSLNCALSSSGERVGPGDFLPRRLMGEYLEWFYEALVAEAPSNVTVFHHETSAVDVEVADGRGERVHLQRGGSLVVDHVVITTGHLPRHTVGMVWPQVAEPYPSQAYANLVRPDDKVAVEGMGLVALDVIAALTMGLGGHFSRQGDGSLRYQPSGREPRLYMYSRTGYPYCAKSFGAADPMGEYQPAICTPGAVLALKTGRDGTRRPINARAELLPLVFAEMELCYYTRAVELADTKAAADRARRELAGAWAAGTFEHARSLYASTYGDFRAAEHFFIGDGSSYTSWEDYEGHVYQAVRSDVEAALVPGGGSPLKAAYETLRALRDTLRSAVEFKSLSFESHLDFQESLRGRFARLVAGPPVVRCQQLLALMDAGVLSVPFGPAPAITHGPAGRAVVRSTCLQRPFELDVDLVVRAHLELPSLSSPSPLIANLLRRRRLRPLTFGDKTAAGIDLDEEFHPLDVQGRPGRRLWIFGVLSEGSRYFTLYIPSPKSRSRAFVDAGVLAREVVAGEPEDAVAATTDRLSKGRAATSVAVKQAPSALGDGLCLRVGLVNNMPDGAFVETEARFTELLTSANLAPEVNVELYTVPGIRRGADIQARVEGRYGRLEALAERPPHALVVTGAEPTVVDLREEPFWGALEQLLQWACSAVPSVLLSCMSAHGALLCLDGVNRRLRLNKCSGVFWHTVDDAHPMMTGIGDLVLPHSRFNEVATEELSGAGYRVLANSPQAGWAIALGRHGCSELLLLQAHPEYTPLTLLREYRRDVRRYLSGVHGSYPGLPSGYLTDEGVTMLAAFEASATSVCRDPGLIAEFPFEQAKAHVKVDWEGPARALMGNWLRRAASRVGIEVGGPLASVRVSGEAAASGLLR